jgi:hypothetical protein
MLAPNFGCKSEGMEEYIQDMAVHPGRPTLRGAQFLDISFVSLPNPDSFYHWMTPTIHYMTSTTSLIGTNWGDIGNFHC